MINIMLKLLVAFILVSSSYCLYEELITEYSTNLIRITEELDKSLLPYTLYYTYLIDKYLFTMGNNDDVLDVSKELVKTIDHIRSHDNEIINEIVDRITSLVALETFLHKAHEII